MQKAKPGRIDSDRNEKRVERVIERAFPAIGQIQEQIVQIFREFDPATPRTTFAKGQQILGAYLHLGPNSIRSRMLVRLVKLGLRSSVLKSAMNEHLDSLIKITKSEAASDPRYSLLLKLMHEVDQATPFGSYIVVHRHADPEELFLTQMNPRADIEAARNTVGERRFNHTAEAFRRTVEHPYDRYIRTLLYLTYIREGKEPQDAPPIKEMPFGGALNSLAHRLSDYPQLFDTRAGWFRNAATHEILDYDLASDSLTLKHGLKSATITTDDLLKLTESLYQVSAMTITLVSQLYLFREIFRSTGLFDACVEYLPRMALETDGSKRQTIEDEFTGHLELIFSVKQTTENRII